MTVHPIRGSLVTLLLAAALSSCARPSDAPATRESDLEKRVAKLEEALSGHGEAGAARPASASPGAAGQAISPQAGAGATPARTGPNRRKDRWKIASTPSKSRCRAR